MKTVNNQEYGYPYKSTRENYNGILTLLVLPLFLLVTGWGVLQIFKNEDGVPQKGVGGGPGEYKNTSITGYPIDSIQGVQYGVGGAPIIISPTKNPTTKPENFNKE